VGGWISYTASRGQGAIDVEEADGTLDGASFERRVDAGCFGVSHGGEFEGVSRLFYCRNGVIGVQLETRIEAVTPIPIMIKRFSIFLEFCDTPPNPKSKNHNSDYHTIITSREVIKISESIIKVEL